MCPSTEATDAQIAFAAYVLQKLLRDIAENNNEGRCTFLVSHAWTEGPMMYLVYKAPPSDIIWGLVRDTRESIIDPGPWPDLDAAVKYYYLLDLEGMQPSEFSCHPGEPGTILWLGDPCEGAPNRPSDIPAAYRYTPSPGPSSVKRNQNRDQPVITEPRLGPTGSTDTQHEFAADVLRNLLRHIEAENNNGHDPFLVSHAWTDGPMMYLVYTAPPSDRTWGLARDTRESIINPSPWQDLDEAVLYYYLLDFEENQPSSSLRRPGEPNAIWWFGFPREGLPARPSDIPEANRYTASPGASSETHGRQQDKPATTEPRRYGNPL